MKRRLLLVLVAIGIMFVASCSDDDSPVADTVAEAGDTIQGGVENAVGGGESTGQSDSDSLPDWAAVLLVVVAVLAVVGVALGLQNRNANKTREASEEGYRQGRQDVSANAE